MKASTGFGWLIVTTLGHLSLLALIGNGSFGRGAECQNLEEWSFLEPDTKKRSDFATPATYKFNSLYYGQIHFLKTEFQDSMIFPVFVIHAQ